MGLDSICRDVSAANHAGGCQALGMFLLPAILEFVACEVAAIESQPTEAVAFHLYPSCPISNRTMLYLIARQCHMMWRKPTSSTTEDGRGDWETVAHSSTVINHPAIGRKQRLMGAQEEDPPASMTPVLQPCTHCGLLLRVGLTTLSVGTIGRPPPGYEGLSSA